MEEVLYEELLSQQPKIPKRRTSIEVIFKRLYLRLDGYYRTFKFQEKGHRLERVHISEKREGHSLERVMEEPRDRLQREARMRCPPHPCKVVVLLTIALLTIVLPTLARLLIALPTSARQLTCLAFSPVCVLK